MNAAVLSRQEIARQRVAVILNALEVADEELAKAYEARDWDALGYKSWQEYCDTELGGLRLLRLSKVTQTEHFIAAAKAGLSTHAIAAAYDVSQGTVRNRLKGAEGLPDVSTGRDGRVRTTRVVRAPRPTPPPTKVECTQAAVLALVAASNGITVHELCAASGWNHGQVSGALSKLHQKKRIERTGVFREGCGVYVATVTK